MKYDIVTFGDPVLRVKSSPVAEVTPLLKRVADGMMETMYAAEGLGLAAQQVGKTAAMCVIDVPPELDMAEDGQTRLNPDVEMPLIMFNPTITARVKDLVRRDEGCLSFPGIHSSVQRSAEVDVEFVDWRGAVKRLHCRGLLARAVQHEMDHLDGVLLVDRLSSVKKISLAGQLKRLRLKTEARLEALREAETLTYQK
jgi:peptide deformylase